MNLVQGRCFESGFRVALTSGAMALFTLLYLQPACAYDLGNGLKVGGLIRFNYSHKDWDPLYRSGGVVDFETAGLSIDYDNGPWVGALQYRYYRYRGGAYTHYPHHAWLGYRLTDRTQVHAGINPIPFGLLPYASHNFYFSMPFYMGLEDTYNLGVKVLHRDGPVDLQAGFYPRDGGDWRGNSQNSARNSYNIVEEGAVRNKERDTFIARAAYTLELAPALKTELGASLLHGRVPNATTRRNGSRDAWALHMKADYRQWGLMLQTGSNDVDLKNPAGQDRRVVVMGGYDFPYEVAADTRFHVANLSYKFQEPWGPLKNMTLYANYSRLDKSASGFRDSQQQVYGMSFSPYDKFFVFVDYLMGKQHPYIGPNYGNSMAAGAPANGWSDFFNINIGYYF